VKRLPVAYSFLVLIGPLLVIAALMAGPLGCGGGGGGGALPTPVLGSLEVGFVDSPSNAFQAIALNVIGVRLNPSTDPNVLDTDPNWQTVSVPPSVASGELSFNLLDFQNDAVVFNIGRIPAQVYNQVELVVDGNIPGMVIPSCTSGLQEGCVTSNAILTTSVNPRTTAPGGINVTAGGLTPLILDVNPGTPVFPTSPGGNYKLNPTITVVSNGFLGTINGSVNGISNVTNDQINAEISGTNSVVASAQIIPSGTGVSNFTIDLPAGVNGTTYDLFVGGSSNFDVASGVLLKRGAVVTVPFSVTTTSAATITGAIIDHRTGGGVVGATVNLLLPASSANNCAISPVGCVVVSTTTSDNGASYSFTVQAPPAGTPYYVQASTTGTDTVTLPVNFSSAPTCPGSPDASNCSISLTDFLLNGTVVVDPPPAAGTNILVTVMAEQHGTGNLVGLTQTTVNATGSSAFSMEVPTKAGNLDLIAAAQDAYLGVGTQFSGHQLAVASNINPAAPPPITMTVTCLGHGTIAGVANSSDANTHVRLFQNGVQLMDSTVGSTQPVPGSTATPAYPNQYSFCAPPSSPGNVYTVQRFEETPGGTTPVGPPQTVTVPVPAPTATTGACPLCANPAGQCPGNCTATTASPL
jgi:hypothetical protein